MADTPSLEERVAALEMAADIAAIPSSWQSLTEAEQEGFIAAIAESRQHVRYRILNAPLTPDEVRQLVRECVTTVGPGETLVIRGRDWTPGQVREVQDWMDADHASGRIDFRVLAVIGDELAVVKPEASDGT